VQHVGGDMFVSIPKGDAILLKVCMCLALAIIQHKKEYEMTGKIKTGNSHYLE
jgi:hypothetical protein